MKNTFVDKFAEKVDLFFKSERFPLYGYLILTCLVLLIYSNIYENSMHFDDHYIFENPAFHSLGNIKQLLALNKFRFIPFYSFVLNYAFSGQNLASYYAVNVFIHIINSLFVFILIRLIMRTPYFRDQEISKWTNFLSLTGALIFAAHPIQTQGVTYIYQRLASLAATFYLGASIFYIRARLSEGKFNKKLFNFAISGAFLVLGFLTKENTFTFPVTMLVLEIMLFSKKFRVKPIFIIIALALAAFGVFAFFKFVGYKNVFLPYKNFNNEDVTAIGYFITQFKVYPLYFFLMLFPVNQNFDHDVRFSYSFADPAVIGGMVFVAATIVAAIFFAKKYRLATFGLFWFYATIAVEASIIPIADPMYEHRLYLPMFGFILVILNFLYKIISLKGKREVYFVIPVLIIILSVMTFARNMVWQNDTTLWGDVVKKSPQKARGYFNLGMSYYMQKDGQNAYKNFIKTIEYDEHFISAYEKIATMYYNSKMYKESLEYFHKVYQYGNTWEAAIGAINMAKIFDKLNQTDSAIYYATKYIGRYPDQTDGYKLRADLYLKSGKYQIADKDLAKAGKLNKGDFESEINRAKIPYGQKDYKKAIQILSAAIDKGTSNLKLLAFAYNFRGMIYFGQKDYLMAQVDFENATSILPDYITALRNSALVHGSLKEYDMEIETIGKIIKITPNDPQAYVERAKVYIYLSNKKMAKADLQKALQIQPKLEEANKLMKSLK